MFAAIDRRFGTWRGAVRLGLAYGEVAGGIACDLRPEPEAVRRLVFVCHGNICRSAYAEALARRAGMETASFGLSTTTGRPAWPGTAEVAARRGLSLDGHAATDMRDFRARPGDYLLAMETRHLRRLSALSGLAHLPRGLLGAYAGVPHLHDPFGLDPAYMETCLTRIEEAVRALCRAFPNAAAAAS
ncbi:hypothetical protein GCM10011371_29440 [Novosphingobium marinum]|uniref:protein-tyrosine-phosphatase n=1 Tax=Novosphingobium marinum TaxID=1514948 RepID=A0A7Y9XY67_9SPHN|nr:phosphotyrosine protein phosphatase [Novosphingobium marinum]NYH96794.1 protein-tyrosine phosphatase [Novosphingobium marinum]GGC40187.1 hypothetical protein GCM10011371_29440 [Novosphingobium marinum]